MNTNCIAYAKPNGSRFVFLFNESKAAYCTLRRTLCTLALDPESSLTWNEAKELAQYANRMEQDRCES